MDQKAWNGFVSGNWENNIDVRDFIVKNYTPYDGTEEFLVDSSIKTKNYGANARNSSMMNVLRTVY